MAGDQVKAILLLYQHMEGDRGAVPSSHGLSEQFKFQQITAAWLGIRGQCTFTALTKHALLMYRIHFFSAQNIQ